MHTSLASLEDSVACVHTFHNGSSKLCTHRARTLQLLYHNIRPVFVFDGGVPALKRRTILMRRERRQAQVWETHTRTHSSPPLHPAPISQLRVGVNLQANRLGRTAKKLLINQIHARYIQVSPSEH